MSTEDQAAGVEDLAAGAGPPAGTEDRAAGATSTVPAAGTGPAADAARAAFRARIAEPGHAVDNVRAAAADLEAALDAGALRRTPILNLMLGDLRSALDAGDDGGAGPLGGKSADAARRISAAIGRELDRA